MSKFTHWQRPSGARHRKVGSGGPRQTVSGAKSAYIRGLIDVDELEQRLEVALKEEQRTLADDLDDAYRTAPPQGRYFRLYRDRPHPDGT